MVWGFFVYRRSTGIPGIPHLWHHDGPGGNELLKLLLQPGLSDLAETAGFSGFDHLELS